MEFNNVAYKRQAKPYAFIHFTFATLLKRFEYFFLILFGYAFPVIRNGDHDMTVFFALYGNLNFTIFFGVGDGIADEVKHDLFQAALVCGDLADIL